ncbi:hypothetical protein V6N13_028490 [Hibiscus sabdariffa]
MAKTGKNQVVASTDTEITQERGREEMWPRASSTTLVVKSPPPKLKDKKSGQAKGREDMGQRKVGHQDDNPSKYKESSTWKGKAKAKDFRGSKKPSSNKCFISDGDHWVREFPQR